MSSHKLPIAPSRRRAMLTVLAVALCVVAWMQGALGVFLSVRPPRWQARLPNAGLELIVPLMACSVLATLAAVGCAFAAGRSRWRTLVFAASGLLLWLAICLVLA